MAKMSVLAPVHRVGGMLFVNKPRGVTSHDVVEVVRRKLGVQRSGHTGTLDPMAEGLLIVLVGAATTHQQAFQGHEKTYEAVLRLGMQTDTGDALGTPLRTSPVPPLDGVRVAHLLTSLQGPLRQTPPAYSDVKVGGHPAYWWARRHQPVTLPSRVVQLFDVSLIECAEQAIRFRVRCSAGTYIRTLGELIAERLETVGCLSSLVRLRIGPWSLDQAKPLSWIAAADPTTMLQELRCVS